MFPIHIFSFLSCLLCLYFVFIPPVKQEADQREEGGSQERETSYGDEARLEGSCHVVNVTNKGRADERGESEHEHADTKGDGDVSREQFEDDNDTGVVSSNGEAEHYRGYDLSSKGRPELGRQN